ncbi:MAG: ferritin [Pseudomonadota bacterium]
MSNSKMLQTLNKLMNGELRAAHTYLEAGAWCAEQALEGCSQYMMAHASEELTHMRKFFDYIVDIDGRPHFTELPEPKIEVDDIADLFEMILKHEKSVTHNIHAALKQAVEEDDFSAQEFLQWYVMEQREEEKTFRDLIDLTKIIGDGPHRLYNIDREVAARVHASADSAASDPG